MQAVRLTALRRLEICDAPEPQLRRPEDVLLRISAVGVCGSDVHYYNTGRIGSQVVRYPFTLGHECAGVVEQAGPAVRHLRPGDRVAVDPAMPCGTCDQCQAGRPHTCRNLKFLGCPGQAEGCLAERLVMPAHCCLRLAEGMSPAQGALSEPLAIGLYAARGALPLKGARAGILGCGPIGLSVLRCVRLLGAAEVYAADPLDYRARAARAAGADWSGAPEADLVERIRAAAPGGLDAVFECCGQQAALDQAVALMRPGGRLMLIGIPETERMGLVIDQARRAEVRVLNVRRQCGCADDTLKLMAAGLLDVDFMVTHRFPMPRTAEAFELVSGYRDGVIKAMIEF